jgi:hypothetical protein
MQLTARSSKIMVSADGTGIVSQAGGLLLTETLRATGLDRGLDAALERWYQPRAVHTPGKIITDLAVTVALGGDCLADVAMLRAQPELFGPAASDPVVSRLVGRLAGDVSRALKAIRAARAAARQRAWDLAGDAAPGADGGLVTVDIDATIVTACSEKEQAMPTWKVDLRPPPADRLRRSRPGRLGRAAGLPAAGRERRLEHRGRPHRGRPAGAGAAAPPPAAPGADPDRLRRRHS